MLIDRRNRRRDACLEAVSHLAWMTMFLLFGTGALFARKSPEQLFSERVLGALLANDTKQMERHLPGVRDYLDVAPGKSQELVEGDEARVARYLEERRENLKRSMMFLRFETAVEPAFEWEYARLVDADRRPRALRAIVAQFCRRIGLMNRVNRAVPSSMDVDIGTVVQAMVLDTLSGRSPIIQDITRKSSSNIQIPSFRR